MFSFRTLVRVVYADTDQMGVVYHGNYARYFEIGRVEALRSLGITYKDVEKKGVIMPVAELNLKFLRPATYDDLLTVQVDVESLPDRRMVFHGMILREEEVLCKSTVVLAFLDASTKRSMSCPEWLLEVFKPVFE